METAIDGRVATEAAIENLVDLWAVERGLLPVDQVRRLVVSDSRVDTGVTLLSLPTKLIHQLGLGPGRLDASDESYRMYRNRDIRTSALDHSGTVVHDGRHGSTR
jgi:hypothetical protein